MEESDFTVEEYYYDYVLYRGVDGVCYAEFNPKRELVIRKRKK